MSIITSVAIIWLFLSMVMILLFFWSGVRRARPMFADDHYRELLALSQKLKPAAIERIGRKLELPGDPRMGITGVGIVILYTIDAEGEYFMHRISFSRAGRYLAFAAGGRFLYVVARSLGVVSHLVGMAHSPRGVVHGAFVLGVREQDGFTRAPQIDSSQENIAQLKTDTNAWFERSIKTYGLMRSEEELLAKVSDRFGIGGSGGP